MRLKIFFWLLLSLYIVNCKLYIQAQTDTTKPHINYRRIDPNNPPPSANYQLPKEQVYPLGWNTGTLGKVTSGTGTWTELNPKVPRVDYLGIHFVNKDTGWAVGDLGTLIKTTDGGSSWTVSETNTTTPILKVRSYNGQVVIASGFDGLILRSSDGGENFTQATSGVTGDLWGLQMLNDTLGFACGNANSLVKTIDGGLSWQTVTTPGYTSDYWWIDFLTESYGFIAANGKVLRTTDGGENWEIIQAGDNQALFTIDVIDSLHIASAGYGGTGYSGKNIYSSDGGYTWINGGSVTTHEINCIKYVNTDTGYIVMSEIGIYKTTNRGQNWNFIPGIEGVGEYELSLLPEMIGYSAGTNIKVYKTENGYENWQRLIINDNFSDVFFTSENKGFAISSYGLSNSSGLYKTDDGGINWERVNGAPDGVDLLFLDSLTGFIGGSNAIYKTTDGGDSWYPTVGATGAGKIFFINSTVGWAVHSRSIYKTTDTGENWIEQITLPADSYTSIFFVDSLNGWATSRYIWQTTDGGVNWIERTDIPAMFSSDIYFLNSDSGWTIDRLSFARLIKTTDGGLNWNEIPEINDPFDFYFFPDPIHWIITGVGIGGGGYIVYYTYITNDYGNSWMDISADVPTGFNEFQAPTNNLGYAVGSSGLILRYDDTTFVPVELLSFEGFAENNEVVLVWQTASELNNQGFYIEKSYDKINWETIGFVNGKGTTTETNYYNFVDTDTWNDEINYRLKQVDFDGTFTYSRIITVYFENTPLNFALYQNYPNPFNPTTSIKFDLPQAGNVELIVYDILGRKVKQLLKETKPAGTYEVTFNASNLSNGVYIYRISAMQDGKILFSESKQMLLIK